MMTVLLLMVSGALLFGAGVVFRDWQIESLHESLREEEPREESSEYLKQWENLLNYDGSRQEEDYEDK